jgi:hypothetical protein
VVEPDNAAVTKVEEAEDFEMVLTRPFTVPPVSENPAAVRAAAGTTVGEIVVVIVTTPVVAIPVV